MNVKFNVGDMVNGFKIVNTNGLSEFYADNGDVLICFRSDAGEGINYSKIMWYTCKHTNRQYRAIRYILKYVSTVQGFSNQLFMKYREANEVTI